MQNKGGQVGGGEGILQFTFTLVLGLLNMYSLKVLHAFVIIHTERKYLIL